MLIYTSGTTGNPKGVMITHDNLIHCAYQQYQHLAAGITLSDDERIVSYLPLSHIAGFAADII